MADALREGAGWPPEPEQGVMMMRRLTLVPIFAALMVLGAAGPALAAAQVVEIRKATLDKNATRVKLKADLSGFNLPNDGSYQITIIVRNNANLEQGFATILVPSHEGLSTVSLQGAVESVAAPTLVVQGIAVHTDPVTRFVDPSTGEIGSSNFFDSLTGVAEGDSVEVEGRLVDGVVIADQVEFVH